MQTREHVDLDIAILRSEQRTFWELLKGWDLHLGMMNFTEKDLLRMARHAGFDEVHVELRVDVEPGSWVTGWDTLMGVSPNANASTVGESISQALTQDEAARFEAHLRPLVDAGRGVQRMASAYVTAVKAR
jgi:hypothetical protein